MRLLSQSPAAVGTARRSLGDLVLALGVAALLLVGWTAAALLVADRKATVERLSAQTLESTAASFREHARQTFGLTEIFLNFVGRTFEHDAELSDPSALAELLEQLQEATPHLRAAALVGPDGRMIANAGDPGRHRDLSRRPHIRAILDDPRLEFYVGVPFVSPSAKRLSIPVAVPWHDADGRPKGVVSGLIEPEYFASFYARSLARQGLSVVLRHADGAPVAGYTETGFSFVDRPVSEAGQVVRLRSAPGGREYMMISQSVISPPLTVSVAEPMELIVARWAPTAWGIGGFALVISLLTVAMALLLRRKMHADARLNEVLRRTAEENNRLADSKFHFLAQVSHELRTPLNAVIGFSAMIGNEKLGPIGNPRYREYAGDIEKSGRYLLSVINDLLDLAKLDAGKIVARDEDIVVAEAMDTVRILMTPLARKNGIVLTVDPPKDEVSLRGDAQLVKQMLVNLVGNAVKFTPEHGEVTMAACLEPGGTLVIRVRDTGPGIPAEDIPRILMPYEQSDSRIARTERGTGLGLALTKKFADLHGARLQIDSVVGLGTVVTLTFSADRVRRRGIADSQAVA